MVIYNDPMSLIALEYKQLSDNDDVKSRARLNVIFKQIAKQFEGLKCNKQRGLALGDHSIIESNFNEAVLYALTKWKGKSPFGGYLSVCFKGITRGYCKEISPVNRSAFTKRVSYDAIIDHLAEYESNLDYDDAGFFNESDELNLTSEYLGYEEVDYSEFNDEYEKWKLE